MSLYLKPCPFCGMEVEPNTSWRTPNYYSIRHRCADGFGALLIETTTNMTLEELVEVWNRRYEEKKENAHEGSL